TIGRGATGSVYQAYDHALFRMVALKILDKDASDPARRSFDRERTALARSQHANIVALYDCRSRSRQPFMALSYHPGPSLQAVLTQGSLSGALTAALGHEISRALDHVHGNGFVYRDLKPENVLIDDERVVLIDFGTAVEVGIDRTRSEVAGTLGFMAPEQYEGRNVDARSDVFGLGALMYEACIGTTPYGVFAKRRRCIRPHRYLHPREAKPDLPESVAHVIHTCLALDPAERYSTMIEVRDALLAVLAEQGVHDPRRLIGATLTES
ncbi:MAG: serine/threonine-protein kinase, partial [Myxococcota bacterium]